MKQFFINPMDISREIIFLEKNSSANFIFFGFQMNSLNFLNI